MKVVLLQQALRALVLTLVALSLAACNLGQAPPAERLCTLIGCGPSLHIVLVGQHVPTDFSMSLVSSTGEAVNVRCTEGTAQFDPPEAARWSPACPAGGVTLQDFAPEHLAVTARWSDGEVTQDFQIAYSESQPNGPDCDPTCRAASLELRIPAMPAYGDVSTWQTYSDEALGFSFRYPAALTLDFGPEVGGYRIVYVGEKIQVRASPANPLVCRGECPMIDSDEPVALAGRDARLVRGYIGSFDGSISQRFMLYLIRSGSTYVSLTLFAASRDATAADPAVILPLQESDIDLLNRIAQTLVFAP